MEVIVAMSIVGILLGIAAPNLREFLRNMRISNQANDLVSDLQLARSEAVKRGNGVGICVSSSGSGCTIDTTGNSWGAGWIVFDDVDGDRALGTGESILRIRGPLRGENDLSRLGKSGGSETDKVFMSRSGTLLDPAGTTITFTLCDLRGINSGRRIELNTMGQVRVIGGTPAACP